MQELLDKYNIKDEQFIDIKVTCMDCHKPFVLNLKRVSPDQIHLNGGAVGIKENKDNNNPKEYKFKCDDCFKIDDVFFGRNEVYSRVVGYLRPVNTWNNAKQEEFGMRKNYEVENE